VVFWTVLGMANTGVADLKADEPVLVEDLHPAIPADEVGAAP
jgi:hypothetical protein